MRICPETRGEPVLRLRQLAAPRVALGVRKCQIRPDARFVHAFAGACARARVIARVGGASRRTENVISAPRRETLPAPSACALLVMHGMGDAKSARAAPFRTVAGELAGGHELLAANRTGDRLAGSMARDLLARGGSPAARAILARARAEPRAAVPGRELRTAQRTPARRACGAHRRTSDARRVARRPHVAQRRYVTLRQRAVTRKVSTPPQRSHTSARRARRCGVSRRFLSFSDFTFAPSNSCPSRGHIRADVCQFLPCLLRDVSRSHTWKSRPDATRGVAARSCKASGARSRNCGNRASRVAVLRCRLNPHEYASSSDLLPSRYLYSRRPSRWGCSTVAAAGSAVTEQPRSCRPPCGVSRHPPEM